MTELYDDEAHDAFVVELSSFQTAELTRSPSVGVLTLLAPDHIDWHRSLKNYYEDKLRLFSLAPRSQSLSTAAVSRRLYAHASFPEGSSTAMQAQCASKHSEVVVPEIGPLDLGGFQLLGEHNLLNVCGSAHRWASSNGRAG